MKQCHDCGVQEGELHKIDCDMEICPVCHKQAITCWLHCVDGKRGLFKKEFYSYTRIPYVVIPTICPLCGEVWPQPFMVPDEEWEMYIIPPLQDKVLCWECYVKQKELFQEGWKKAD